MRRRVVAAILTNPADAARLRALVHEVCAGSCERVALVAGASPGVIAHAVEGLPVAMLPNLLWSEGTASAIRCAVAWALRSGADGLLLVHGDHARLDRAHVENLITTFRATRTPVASYVDGESVLPAVFGIESFARLGHLTGDHDAGVVLRTTPIVKVLPWPSDVGVGPTAIPELPASPVVLAP